MQFDNLSQRILANVTPNPNESPDARRNISLLNQKWRTSTTAGTSICQSSNTAPAHSTPRAIAFMKSSARARLEICVSRSDLGMAVAAWAVENAIHALKAGRTLWFQALARTT